MPPAQSEQWTNIENCGPDYFATTHWSIVLSAGQDGGPGTEQALEKLCRAYWYPLFAYVRRRGHSPHDAQDLTQELFKHLKVYLTGEKRTASYADLAAELKTTEGALKMTVQRMRHRYRELLRDEIGQTVTNAGEIEDELRALLGALG